MGSRKNGSSELPVSFFFFYEQFYFFLAADCMANYLCGCVINILTITIDSQMKHRPWIKE